jgi:hypothetical protein
MRREPTSVSRAYVVRGTRASRPVAYALRVVLLVCIACAGCGGGPSKLERVVEKAAKKPDPLARYVSDAVKPVSQPLGVVFGDQLELVGINVPAEVKIGEPFEVELVWHCLAEPSRDWQIALLFDHPKPWWRLNEGHWPPVPTTMWRKGLYVSWTVEVTFPAKALPGDYTIDVHPFVIVKKGPPQVGEVLPATANKDKQRGKMRVIQ